MVNYLNPNIHWRARIRGFGPKDQLGCLHGILFLLLAAALVVAAAMFAGCTTTQYVPLPETHTEHHWHTDSVHTTDSIYNEKETVIMQLDSAAMAHYGIQLKQAERAWLVKSKELERRIEQLMQLSQTKDTIRDSIPVPYPVPATLSRWQRFCCDYGKLMVGATAAMLLALIFVIVRRIRSPTL